MLTRRAKRAHGLREAREAALSLPLLGPLPGDLVKLILRLLPLDGRLCAREVRRGWCALLEDASFWTRVDLSASSGVNPRFLTPFDYGKNNLFRALFRAACAQAKDSLQSLDLSGVGHTDGAPLGQQWVAALSAANKASLRDLVAPPSHRFGAGELSALCRALPLCRVRCAVYCYTVDALPLLRREPPFALLTIDHLSVSQDPGGEQAVLDLASALSGHKGMEKLSVGTVPLATRAVVDALVDAAISAGIKDAGFYSCGLTQIVLPALGRLLQSPDLERLKVCNQNVALFEGPGLPAFCDVLRNCKSLKTLRLGNVNLWADTAAASQLIAALEVLPAQQEVSLLWNHVDVTPATQHVAGECLARLIARSTSLWKLDLDYNELGEAGLAPIFQALRGNASLVELSLNGEQIRALFVRNVVLPAVRSNTTLRILEGLRSVASIAEPLSELEEVKDILEAQPTPTAPVPSGMPCDGCLTRHSEMLT